MNLTDQQADILNHAIHRAAGGFYCGDSPVMRELVAAGMMKSAGFKSFVPDEYFTATQTGMRAISEWRAMHRAPTL